MLQFKSFHSIEELDVPDESAHMIVWWIDKKLTLDEWIELDDRMSEVLYKTVGDNFGGYAGPIPEIGENVKEQQKKEKLA